MDGVLVDGEPLHFRAVNSLLGEEGLSVSLERYKPYMGTKTGWSDMMRDHDLSRSRAYYSARYREIVLDIYKRDSVAMPGAVELVRSLREAGVATAVASSSIEPWVLACFETIGLADAFDSITTGSDVSEGKPDPEVYLSAAKRLGARPESCLAFEDAPAGIESAHRAGMICWAVRTDYTKELELPHPEREFDSLTEVTVAEIAGVLI